MKIHIALITIIVLSVAAFGQTKKPVKRPVKSTVKPKIYTAVGVTESAETPPATAQKVYVMKTDGDYLYGIFIGGNGEFITIKTEDSTVTVKLDEIDKIIVKEGIATRIGGTSATATNATELTFKGSGNSGQTDSPKKISGGVLNGKAETLVKPTYPPAAAAVRASGAVNVQVTIDEQGNIVSASAISGHPLLRQVAEKAATASKFAPTLLEGQPVSVTGVIVYNFVP